MDILYEDDDIIVVCKPSGIAVQSGRVGESDMASELKKYLKTDYIGIVHRLDQPVQGLLVFGKTKPASASLSAQLRDSKAGVFNKRYDAISVLKKENIPKSGRLRDMIDTDRTHNLSFITDKPGEGKEAVLEYTMNELSDDACRACTDTKPDGRDVFAHVKIDLVTGRRHQIRLQLSHAGMPIVGDRKYGVMPEGYKGSICLAATELTFRHPSLDEKMCFEANPSFLKER